MAQCINVTTLALFPWHILVVIFFTRVLVIEHLTETDDWLMSLCQNNIVPFTQNTVVTITAYIFVTKTDAKYYLADLLYPTLTTPQHSQYGFPIYWRADYTALVCVPQTQLYELKFVHIKIWNIRWLSTTLQQS